MNMRIKLILQLLIITLNASPQSVLKDLPLYSVPQNGGTQKDWLIDSRQAKAGIYRDAERERLILSNGLLTRSFCFVPGLACIDFRNESSGEQLIRSVKPEAKITVNGKELAVGGLMGQKENAYLMSEWLYNMNKGKEEFIYEGFESAPISPYLQWKSNTWKLNGKQATGLELRFLYHSNPSDLAGLQVTVHYALFDEMPLICKWISLKNQSNQAIKIDRVVNEILATPEEESAVVGETNQMKIPHGIYIESNYAFNNAMRYDLSDQTTHWKADSSYTSQVNYNFKTPCLLEVYVEKGPGITLNKGDTFSSIRSYELLLDSYDRERRGLSIRKMYGLISPWTTQNPIFMHLVSKSDEEVRLAIDQCTATGYEALILSFGSHCDMEDTSAANIRKWKSLADYAHQKNILIGSYSLFSSRRISDEDDVIDPATGKPDKGAFFGHAPCYGSRWGLEYSAKLKWFISQTGFNILENDGPYPGDQCASTSHPGHTGLDDSQWRQMELQKDLYHWCNEHAIYLNAPDWYFLDGTNKIALGYREVNFSLPRAQQLIINRQNIFDGTWEKTASMSWGFVPLTRYQGGGPEAVIEPLHEHLKDYVQLMIQYYGAGVQACYRGQRLYDTEDTRKAVVNMINWYKEYRTILNAPIIHLRRADGRDWDGWMHVDPKGKIRAMLLLFNPGKKKITRTIDLPLYYTGLGQSAKIRNAGKALVTYSLKRNYSVQFTFTLEPESYQWYTIE